MSGADKPRLVERRASLRKPSRRDLDRLRASNADIEVDDDDGHHTKGGSTVWKPKTKMACTYRMGPVRKFLPHVVKKRAQEILDKAFTDLAYDHDNCREVSDKVSTDTMAFVKEQAFDRYRYVVRVVVGEKKGQTVKIVGRALWDQEKDNFLTVTHENRHLYAVCTVFALYFE
ncbi:dynein light chain Tctex-type 5 [Clupea harengus]|uniref:Dynein light chain Tctex-type 5 n=1 Tax=Clupea harengus TaxID=7950 RepID=A0A6P3W2L4_CLUHA|nr:dynein light chain Tctex-type 5 [Clupea harengus]